MRKILLIVIALLASLKISAYDFEFDGIYYEFTDFVNLKVKVTSGDNKYAGDIVIPEKVVYDGKIVTVSSIGAKAFSGCKAVTSVQMSDSIKYIGNEAFANCTNLIKIELPIHISSLSNSLFYNCSHLEEFVIPDSVKQIGQYVFYRCKSLKQIIIPSNVEEIGYGAFSGCSGLSSVEIPNSVKNIHDQAFWGCSNLKNVSILDGITELVFSDEDPFYGCPLETVYIGRNYSGYLEHNIVGGVVYYQFGWNATLKSVKIGPLVTKIGLNAFEGNSALQSVEIGENVENIGVGAFRKCTALEQIQIPNSVKWIGAYAFRYCAALNNVVLSDSLEILNDYIFADCSALTSIQIPIKISKISYNAFENCTSLKYLEFPYSVQSIASSAFSGCENMEFLRLYNTKVSLGNKSFSGCNKLRNIYCTGNEPKGFATDVFDNEQYLNTTLYVPRNKTDVYKSVSGWRNFSNVVEYDVPAYVVSYIIDGVEVKKDTINMYDPIPYFEPLKEGHTFSGWSEMPDVMPAHNIVVTGSFIVNTYKITYLVDGGEYKTVEVKYGESIPAEAEPVKEGHTFSGWNEIPETMPAMDVTITGSFSINTYKVVYIVDDEEYKVVEVVYGESIPAEEAPVKEGYTFSGWSEVPETMPAHDITVTGSFTIIDSITGIPFNTKVDVYNLNGIKIASQIAIQDIRKELPRGIYIINGKKCMLK